MKNILIALLMGLTIGALAGWYATRGSGDKAKVEVLSAVVQEIPKAVEAAQVTSVALQSRVDQLREDYRTYGKEIARHVPVRQPQPAAGPGLSAATAGLGFHAPGQPTDTTAAAGPTEVHLAHGGDRLLAGAVCLLDAARAGEDPGRAAGRCDEAGDTPSAVDVGQLLDADLDAVSRYNALMAQHNALIDFVEDLQRKTQE